MPRRSTQASARGRTIRRHLGQPQHITSQDFGINPFFRRRMTMAATICPQFQHCPTTADATLPSTPLLSEDCGSRSLRCQDCDCGTQLAPLHMLPVSRRKEKRQGVVLPMDFVKSKLRLDFASSQVSCQGSTLAGRVRVYTHPRFTRRHLYVCASRATSARLLEIC